MSVFIYRSLPRLTGTLTARKSFANLSECFQLTESSQNVATLELYDAFKFIASSPQQRQDAIKDDRFAHLLSNLDSRLCNLNTSYLGNFALRLVTILQSHPLISDDKDSNASKGKEVLERICSEMLQKEASVKEIAQVAFAAANAGLDTDFYDYAKQQMTLNIENANADSLNLALLTAYKRSMRDKAYLALLCEKLSELTDRFTANDVVSTLRSLAKTGLLKGFLLRRLSTLVHDNLDQFSEVQLAQATYRLALLKFQTPSQFSTIYKAMESKINTLPSHFQVEVLTAGCLSRSFGGGQLEALVSLAKSIEPQKDWDMITLINYVYSCVSLKVYDQDRLGAALASLLARSPFVLRKYALLFKEAYNALVLESPEHAPTLPDAWKEALDKFETSELDYVKQVPIFTESERILKGSSSNFEPFVKIDPFTVSFADLNRKLVILAENGNILGSLDLTERNLKNMGYKVGLIKYWEWRRLKTEVGITSRLHFQGVTIPDKMSVDVHLAARRAELKYAFTRFDSKRQGILSWHKLVRLLATCGIHLTRSELKFLEFEEDMRGGFTLEDLWALGDVFYTDYVIESKVSASLREHFGHVSLIDKEDLTSILLKLGGGLGIHRAEIEAFLNFHAPNSNTIPTDKFLDSILAE